MGFGASGYAAPGSRLCPEPRRRVSALRVTIPRARKRGLRPRAVKARASGGEGLHRRPVTALPAVQAAFHRFAAAVTRMAIFKGLHLPRRRAHDGGALS